MAAKLTKAFARATGSGTDIMGGYRVATVDYHRYAKQSSAELIAEGAIS